MTERSTYTMGFNRNEQAYYAKHKKPKGPTPIFPVVIEPISEFSELYAFIARCGRPTGEGSTCRARVGPLWQEGGEWRILINRRITLRVEADGLVLKNRCPGCGCRVSIPAPDAWADWAKA